MPRKPVKKKTREQAIKSLNEIQRKAEAYAKEEIASGRVKVTPEIIKRFKDAKPPKNPAKFKASKVERVKVKEEHATHTGTIKTESVVKKGGRLGSDVVRARIKETHPSGKKEVTDVIRVNGKLAVAGVKTVKKKRDKKR